MDKTTEMAEQAESKTIYMSPELRQANDNVPRGSRENPIPAVKPLSSHRLNSYVQSHDRGLRRSFGSTDLLHNAHPNSNIALSSDSADSLEGAMPLHSDKLQSNMDITPKSHEGSKISIELERPAAGEGKSSDKKPKAGVVSAEDEEKEERWVDASDIGESTEEGREVKGEQEEDKEGAMPLPFIGQAGKKHQCMDDTAASVYEDSNYLQDFHRLPKSLVSSEITHCLYMLEEECRGVEKESESVKWKMEFIHGSMQCVQETLRTLLIRLVEAQSSSHHVRDAMPDPSPPPPLPPQQFHPLYAGAVDADPNHSGAHSSANAHHHHHHHHHHSLCKALHPVTSKTCLTDGLNPGQCCQAALPTDMPSCAQRAKERTAAFSAITELRADVERLRMAHLEERQEQKEALRVLKDFQRQVEDLISAQRGNRNEEGCSSVQLLQLKQEVQEVADMTRQAMAALQKLGIQLESLGAEANSKQSEKFDS